MPSAPPVQRFSLSDSEYMMVANPSVPTRMPSPSRSEMSHPISSPAR